MRNHPLPNPPLPLPRDNWRSRWLVNSQWQLLHRVSSIQWNDGDMTSGQGVTVCGSSWRLTMPGLFSRTGLKRCPKCCRLLSIPQGGGAPFNVLVGDDADV